MQIVTKIYTRHFDILEILFMKKFLQLMLIFFFLMEGISLFFALVN